MKKVKSKDKSIMRTLKKKIPYKQISKSNQMVVKIEDYKAPSVLGDENRFFTGEFEKEKRSLFLQ